MREHLEAVERQTGEAPEALQTGEVPEDAIHVWQWFCRLSARRQSGMGPAPIGWPQIRDFFDLIRIRPDEWEVRAIELLDNAWLNAQAENQTKEQK